MPVVPATQPDEAPCPSCGHPIAVKFCSHCGEKRREPHDYSVAHFLEQCAEAVAHTDSKALGTFKQLIRRPGLLTNEYMAGVRKRYLSPVQVFIIANVLYFALGVFSYLLTGAVPNMHLYTTRPPGPGGHWLDDRVQHASNRRGVSVDEYVDLFNEKAESKAESLVIIAVPIFAIGLALVQLGSRRYMVEHLVFSFHLFGVFLLAASSELVVGDLLFVVRTYLLHAPRHEWIAAALDGIWWIPTLAYLFLAMRRVYRDRWTKMLWKFPVLAGWLLASYSLYYMFLIQYVLLTA